MNKINTTILVLLIHLLQLLHGLLQDTIKPTIPGVTITWTWTTGTTGTSTTTKDSLNNYLDNISKYDT